MVTTQHPVPKQPLHGTEKPSWVCLTQSSAEPPSLLHPQLLAVPTAHPIQPRGTRPPLKGSSSLHDRCLNHPFVKTPSLGIRTSYGKVPKLQGGR